MGGNIGSGVGINFAPFREVSAVTYAFLVGYFTKYPASATALSSPGAFLMKMPLVSPTTASDLCDTFTVAFTGDSNLFQTLSVTFPVTPATNHFTASSSFTGFSVDNSAVKKTLKLSGT